VGMYDDDNLETKQNFTWFAIVCVCNYSKHK